MATPPSSPPPLSLAVGLSREFLLHHRLCPKQLGPDGTVIVAPAPDSRPEALDDIPLAYRREVVPEDASIDEVERLIGRPTTPAKRSIELERSADSQIDDALTTDVR